MKKLALLFFVILGLSSGVSQAQLQQNQQDDTVLTMPISVPCVDADKVVSDLEIKHGELPFAQGDGIVWNSKINDYIGVKVLVFVNPNTFTFSLAYYVAEDDLLCIMTLGDRFEPVRRGNSL